MDLQDEIRIDLNFRIFHKVHTTYSQLTLNPDFIYLFIFYGKPLLVWIYLMPELMLSQNQHKRFIRLLKSSSSDWMSHSPNA